MDVPAAKGGGEQQKVTPFCQLARGSWQGSAVSFGEALLRSAERVYMDVCPGLTRSRDCAA